MIETCKNYKKIVWVTAIEFFYKNLEHTPNPIYCLKLFSCPSSIYYYHLLLLLLVLCSSVLCPLLSARLLSVTHLLHIAYTYCPVSCVLSCDRSVSCLLPALCLSTVYVCSIDPLYIISLYCLVVALCDLV